MKSNRPRSVNPGFEGQTDKFAGVESSNVNRLDSIRERLDKDDEEMADFDPCDIGFKVQPCFSHLHVKVIDKRVTDKKSAAGIILIERQDRLPYMWVEVLGAGPAAGINRINGDYTSNFAIEKFEVGDVLMVYEKHVAFHYLDDKPHSEFFEYDRPYVATIPDTYIILKKVKE